MADREEESVPDFPDLAAAVANRLRESEAEACTELPESMPDFASIPDLAAALASMNDTDPEACTVLDGADQETTVEIPIHDDEAPGPGDDATDSWPFKFDRFRTHLGQLAGSSKCGQLAGL